MAHCLQAVILVTFAQHSCSPLPVPRFGTASMMQLTLPALPRWPQLQLIEGVALVASALPDGQRQPCVQQMLDIVVQPMQVRGCFHPAGTGQVLAQRRWLALAVAGAHAAHQCGRLQTCGLSSSAGHPAASGSGQPWIGPRHAHRRWCSAAAAARCAAGATTDGAGHNHLQASNRVAPMEWWMTASHVPSHAVRRPLPASGGGQLSPAAHRNHTHLLCLACRAVKDPADVAEALVRLWPWIEAALGKPTARLGRGQSVTSICSYMLQNVLSLKPSRLPPATHFIPPPPTPHFTPPQTASPAIRPQ